VAAFFAANVLLTQQVFGLAVAAGVCRFIHMSSAGVLGSASPAEGFSDDSPANPHDDYTRSKFQAEEWLYAQGDSRIELVVVRPPLVHGPGASGNFARLMRITDTNWPLPFKGLRAERSMIGVRNLCDLLVAMVLAPRVPHRPVLACDGERTSISDLTARLRTLRGRSPRMIYVPTAAFTAALRIAGLSREIPRLIQPFVLRPRLAFEVMGWRPPYELQEELRWAVASEAGAQQC
jgi:UDP-glucose 4-epimerase